MEPKWFLESDKWGEDITALKNEIERQGMTVSFAEYPQDTIDRNYVNSIKDEDCVIYYGSLGFAAYLRKESKWIPGVYWHPTAYNCTEYYPYFGDLLLNNQYMMLPIGDMKRRKHELYERFGEDRTIFVRPNSGNKLFTGMMIYVEDFDKDIDYLDNLPKSELIVVSPPRNVQNEWRFVCVDKKIVAGSQYRFMGQVLQRNNDDLSALGLAIHVARQDYQPARVWCIDVCQTGSNSYYLMEVGCFSCAGLYRCNLEDIVREVSRVAMEEYNEINNV